MFKLVNGKNIPLTQSEIEHRQAEEQAWLIEKTKRDKRERRQKALAEKWPDPFDLLDDILERGIEVVKTERNAIKQANPKG